MDENKLMVSVDVEDWYHHLRVTGASFSTYENVDSFFDDWTERYDYLTEPTMRVLNLFDEFDITATFFVVADIVDNYPGLVEEISDRGHFIECHGLHHKSVLDPDTKEPQFSKREFRQTVSKAQDKLESESGQEIIGYRAPNAYVAGWMLDELEKLGFKYDSSVSRNSLYNKTDSSLSDVGTAPYIPRSGDLAPGGTRPFIEFPWPNYNIRGFRIPTAGGSLVRLFGRRIISKGIKQSLKQGHTVFYFHPLEISRESLPEVGNSRRRPGYWMFKGEPAERRIRRILNDIPTKKIMTHQTVMESDDRLKEIIPQ